MNRIYRLYENLQEKGYKLTEHRKLILDVFIENKDFLLEPAEIFERVLKKNKDINFSTIYRNLETFISVGIVRKISLEDGKSSYQILFEDQHIHSIICKKCGRVESLRGCPLEKIDLKEIEKKGFQPDSHKFEIYGFCKNCLSNKRP